MGAAVGQLRVLVARPIKESSVPRFGGQNGFALWGFFVWASLRRANFFLAMWAWSSRKASSPSMAWPASNSASPSAIWASVLAAETRGSGLTEFCDMLHLYCAHFRRQYSCWFVGLAQRGHRASWCRR